MDMHAAYREVGTYRGAAEICGTTPKTVKRALLAAKASAKGEDPVVEHNCSSSQIGPETSTCACPVIRDI